MAEKKEEKKAEKKPLNVMLIIQMAFSVVNLVVIGGGAYLVYSSTIGWHPPVVSEAHLASVKEKDEHGGGGGSSSETAGPLLYTMDKFTVNLGGEPKRTIRIEVNLEMLGKDGFE